MAIKKFYHDIDLLNVGELVGARTQNVTTAERDALAGILGANNEGLQIWDTQEKVGFTWDGGSFVRNASVIEGDVVFKGLFDATLAIDDENQPQEIEAKAGHQYIVTGAGTFNAGETGISITGEDVLEDGDKILFVSETEAYVFQTNVDSADTVKAGLVRIATEQETLEGTNSTAAVTPATLEKKLEGIPRAFSTTVNVDAGVPATVTHNLDLTNRDAFVVSAMVGNSTVSVDVESVDADSITVTSSVDLTDLRVTVLGY